VNGLEPRIRRGRSGKVEVLLSPVERVVIRAVPGQLREALDRSDPAARRLSPPAHDDAIREAEYRGLVGSQLDEGRRRNIEVMEATSSATTLEDDQAAAWLAVMNDLRLVLGERLEITEDSADRDLPEDDPRAPALATFHYLGWLVSQLVDALEP
jgi:hypothetical protein